MLGKVYFQPPLYAILYAVHFLLDAQSASRCYSQFCIDAFWNIGLIVSTLDYQLGNGFGIFCISFARVIVIKFFTPLYMEWVDQD